MEGKVVTYLEVHRVGAVERRKKTHAMHIKIKKNPTYQLCEDDPILSRTPVIRKLGKLEMIDILIQCNSISVFS